MRRNYCTPFPESSLESAWHLKCLHWDMNYIQMIAMQNVHLFFLLSVPLSISILSWTHLITIHLTEPKQREMRKWRRAMPRMHHLLVPCRPAGTEERAPLAWESNSTLHLQNQRYKKPYSNKRRRTLMCGVLCSSTVFSEILESYSKPTYLYSTDDFLCLNPSLNHRIYKEQISKQITLEGTEFSKIKILKQFGV